MMNFSVNRMPAACKKMRAAVILFYAFTSTSKNDKKIEKNIKNFSKTSCTIETNRV
jgi:hypothetical protein